MENQRANIEDLKVSVIIPVIREADIINETIASLLQKPQKNLMEIIVVDGDPEGSTLDAIAEPTVIKHTSPKGRGTQMNRGARAASGDIFLFLHADTTLPPQGINRIKEVIRSRRYVGGAFNYSIDSNNPILQFNYYTSYLRARVNRIPYGDMAIFFSAPYFREIGGYADIPLMEDVELMKRVRKRGDKICILKDKIKTSARRYQEEGMIRGWLRNYRLRILYKKGCPPEELVKFYPDTRRQKK